VGEPVHRFPSWHRGGVEKGDRLTALLLLSGGIDSAYVLWQALQEGRSVHAHHVHLTNHEGRVRHEAEAVDKVRGWVSGEGLPAYPYTESSFDYGTLRFIVKDLHIWAFIAGVIAADPRNKHIDSILLPRHSDAFPSGPNGPGAQRSDRAYRDMPRMVCGRTLRLEFPIVHMTKAEVVAATPPGLLACCWYCRRPRDGRTCGACQTCKQVQPALEAA
jgi:hypothetical protein